MPSNTKSGTNSGSPSSLSDIRWSCKHFSELSTTELYQILQLRAEVFVVEQNCPYQDCDNVDQDSFHLCGYAGENLLAYCRLIPPGISYEKEASIGRVITAFSVRGQHLGKELMKRGAELIYELIGKYDILISGQIYAQKFYEDLEYLPEGDIFLIDGIKHIHMRKHP